MIKTILVMIASFFRILFLKIFHGTDLKGSLVQRISPWSSVVIKKPGQMILGKNICISKYSDVYVGKKGSLYIGDKVFFNNGLTISCQNKVSIGSNSLFGPNVKIYDNNHKFNKEDGVRSDLSIGEISIGANCWIGANSVILKNAQIGDKCVIGAGCVIKGNIPAGSIVTMDKKYKIEQIR